MTAAETCQEAGISVEFIKDFVEKYAPRDGGYSRPANDFQPTVFDYRLIAAAIQLRAALPPSHASTSIMKTLRGTAIAKVCKNRPEFGMVEGMKVYKNKFIFGMVQQVERMLKAGDVSEEDDVNEFDDTTEFAPCFIREGGILRTNKEWATKIAEAFEACGQEFGIVAPEPKKKKSKSVKIKTEVLFQTIEQAGILEEARAKGKELCDEFIANQPSEPEPWMYYDWVANGVRSKIAKDDHIKVKFYLGPKGFTNRKPGEAWRSMRIAKMCPNTAESAVASKYPWKRVTGEDNYSHIEKAPVLVAKMSLDGTQVLEWDVTLEKYTAQW